MTKEEKALEKARLKDEARLNKSLVAVPKKTVSAMGLLSVEPKGTFRMADGRFVKVLVVEDVLPLQKTLVSLPCRMRITSRFLDGERDDFVSLISYETTYPAAKKQFDEALSVLSDAGVSYQALTVDDTMTAIMRIYGKDGDFHFTEAVRKRKDTFRSLAMREPSDVTDISLSIGDILCGSAYFLMVAEPGFRSPVKKMIDANLSFMTVLDIAPISAKSLVTYKKVMEAHFDRQVSSVDDGNFVNASYYLVTLTESEEARKTMEEVLFSLFPSAGEVISTCVGIQKKVMESAFTLGLYDSTYMRMMSLSDADRLIV